MSGLFTFTNTTISWNTDLAGNAADLFTLALGAGAFSGENGQNQIENLVFSSQPVGVQFAATDFINFIVDPSVPSLNITYIAPGMYTNAGCSLPVTVGDTCTPNVNGGVGFLSFVDTSTNQSTATWVFDGVEVGQPNTIWTATFTSQFSVPYQTVLANIASPTFSVTNSYTAAVSASPEPSALIMVGIGLGLFTLWRAGANRKRKTL
jgi:hypothetical protein